MNYLPDAHRHGATIFCSIEVDLVVEEGAIPSLLAGIMPVVLQRRGRWALAATTGTP